LIILLHFIPARWTGELQPLEQYVFGALKAICRKLFARHYTAGNDVTVTKSDVPRFLLEAWSALEVAVIEKGWGIYEDDIGDTADADDEDDSTWEE
jgi:hypothetical protein